MLRVRTTYLLNSCVGGIGGGMGVSVLTLTLRGSTLYWLGVRLRRHFFFSTERPPDKALGVEPLKLGRGDVGDDKLSGGVVRPELNKGGGEEVQRGKNRTDKKNEVMEQRKTFFKTYTRESEGLVTS